MVQCHVACALHGPSVVLFEQVGADHPGHGGFVWKGADGISAALDLAIEAFKLGRDGGRCSPKPAQLECVLARCWAGKPM